MINKYIIMMPDANPENLVFGHAPFHLSQVIKMAKQYQLTVAAWDIAYRPKNKSSNKNIFACSLITPLGAQRHSGDLALATACLPKGKRFQLTMRGDRCLKNSS
ncbi:hypothetical protein [Pseudomonas syringae]|nr:hypothetical protein [Pseudomonas syringae]